jgi:hypothetical protein
MAVRLSIAEQVNDGFRKESTEISLAFGISAEHHVFHLREVSKQVVAILFDSPNHRGITAGYKQDRAIHRGAACMSEMLRSIALSRKRA